jgi:hypothetical protein
MEAQRLKSGEWEVFFPRLLRMTSLMSECTDISKRVINAHRCIGLVCAFHNDGEHRVGPGRVLVHCCCSHRAVFLAHLQHPIQSSANVSDTACRILSGDITHD